MCPTQAELELQHLRWPRRSVAQVGPAAFAALSRSLVAGTVQGMCVCPAPPSPLCGAGGNGAQGGPRLGLRPGAARSGDDTGGGASQGGLSGSRHHSPYVTPVLMVSFDNGSVQCYTSPAHLAVVEKERTQQTAAAAAATAAAAAAAAAEVPPAAAVQPLGSPSSPSVTAAGREPGSAAAPAAPAAPASGEPTARKGARVKQTRRCNPSRPRLWQQPPPVASPARRAPADRAQRTAWASYLTDASSDEELPVVSSSTSGRRSSSLRGEPRAPAQAAAGRGGEQEAGGRSSSGQESTSDDELFVSFRSQVRRRSTLGWRASSCACGVFFFSIFVLFLRRNCCLSVLTTAGVSRCFAGSRKWR